MKMEARKIWPVLLPVLVGCSDKPTWRDHVADADAKKAERIEVFESHGLTSEEAEGAWWAEEIKFRTETGSRDDVIRE